jgi:uncharacterized Fe-S cluster protein YjdI
MAEQDVLYPNGDSRCVHNNGKDCWVIPDDPDYQCVGIERCPNGMLRETDE